MLAWWNSLGLVSQIFSCIAIPATVVLLIQTVLMFLGLESEGGDPGDVAFGDDALPDGDVAFDADMDAVEGVFGDGMPVGDPDPSGLDGLRVFSVRGIIAFLVVFGWVGFVMDSTAAPLWVSLSLAALCGLATMVALAFLFRAVLRLRNNGNLDNRNALGVSGRVYLTVPAARSGEGKVNLLLQGTYVERDAVTDEEEPLPTGCEVLVVGTSGQTTLVVKRK